MIEATFHSDYFIRLFLLRDAPQDRYTYVKADSTDAKPSVNYN